jgi:hypothetical protein
MKQLSVAFILTIICVTAIAQSPKPGYSVSKDNTGTIIFNGQITFDDLNKEKSFGWLKSGADDYKPKAAAIAYLTKNLSQYNMIVFMGTWCSDSRYLVPKLEKVLQLTAYPMQQNTMYGVDHAKKTKAIADDKYNITLVPTIILLKGQQEIGRITETVQASIEADLAAIIQKDQQQH